jgi:hypothetical protein
MRAFRVMVVTFSEHKSGDSLCKRGMKHLLKYKVQNANVPYNDRTELHSKILTQSPESFQKNRT